MADPDLTRCITLAGGAVPPDHVDATAAAALARCWNKSALTARAHPHLDPGDTVTTALASAGATWNPQWLIDAGYVPADASGNSLLGGATALSAGRMTWTPTLHLPRVTDKPADNAGIGRLEMQARWAGEVAVAALWMRAANLVGITPADVDLTLGPSDGGTRGARFKQALIEVLRGRLGAGWTIYPEVPLAQIRGLHLRQDVGTRKSDIAAARHDMLAAIVSSKWTWRSDRGTEAAQVLFLKRYRPDVPYALVTNEFVRARVVAQESVEDAAYFLCPRWIGASVAIQTSLAAGRSLVADFPSLQAVIDEGDAVAHAMGLKSLFDLVTELSIAYRLL